MKNRALLLLFFFYSFCCFAQTGKRIYPTDDTYVFSNGGNENAVIRHIEDSDRIRTYTHQSDDTWTYRSYLKFDISGICNNPELIENVVFKIVGKENQGNFEHSVSIYALSEDNWNEDDLTYDTRNKVGTAAKITTVKKHVGNTNDVWFDFDITEKIKEYKSLGKNTISLMLSDDTNVRNPQTNAGSIINFYSKEAAGTNAPRLAVEETDISSLLLSDIKLNGITVDGFNQEMFHYSVSIEPEWTDVPVIAYTKVNDEAVVQVENAKSLIGSEEDRTTTIRVSADSKSLTYTLTFNEEVLSDVATLKNIFIDGTALEFFESTTFSYKHYLPYTYNDQPGISLAQDNRKQITDINLPLNIRSENEAERLVVIKVTSADKTTNEEYKILFTVLPKLDLFLCIGQSNMAGRGPMDEGKGDLLSIDNCYLFTPEFGFEKASNPMNKYSNIRKTLSEQQISPAYGFAKYIADNQPETTFGMIVNAKGGTSIEEWSKGAELYNKTVARTKKALSWGELKAILWHQGESNTGSVDTYPAKLNKMVSDLREDLSSPGVFFVAGELIRTWSQSQNFNTMLRNIAENVTNSDWVSSEGLNPRSSGDVHFDRIGNITLGERYAEKVIEKIYTNTTVPQYQESAATISVDGKNIQIVNSESNSTLFVYDMLGCKIFSAKINEDYTFSLHTSGIYNVVISSDNHLYINKVFVK